MEFHYSKYYNCQYLSILKIYVYYTNVFAFLWKASKLNGIFDLVSLYTLSTKYIFFYCAYIPVCQATLNNVKKRSSLNIGFKKYFVWVKPTSNICSVGLKNKEWNSEKNMFVNQTECQG